MQASRQRHEIRPGIGDLRPSSRRARGFPDTTGRRPATSLACPPTSSGKLAGPATDERAEKAGGRRRCATLSSAPPVARALQAPWRTANAAEAVHGGRLSAHNPCGGTGKGDYPHINLAVVQGGGGGHPHINPAVVLGREPVYNPGGGTRMEATRT